MGSKKKIFLDTSVILSALFSQKGASYCILHQPFEIELQINEYVFRELYEAITNKYKSKQDQLLPQLFSMLAEAHVVFVANPGKNDLMKIEEYISKKDGPILATALSYSDKLLSLDNEFFGERIINLSILKELTILKPGDFLENYRKMG